MKTLEQLQQIVTTGDWSSLLPIIVQSIETSARPKERAKQFFKWSNEPAKQGLREVRIPATGTISVNFVEEGTALTPTEAPITYVSCTPKKIGVAIKFSRETIKFKRVDIVQSQLDEAGVSLVKFEDAFLFNELMGYYSHSPTPYTENIATETLTGGGANTIYTLAHSPLIEVIDARQNNSSGSPVEITTIDYYRGKVKVATDLTGKSLWIKYSWSVRTNKVNANTVGTVRFEDLVNASSVIKTKYYEPSVVIVPEDHTVDILGDSRFFPSGVFEKPIVTGEVGKLAGLRVVFTPLVKNMAIVLDMDNCASGFTFRELEMLEDVEVLSDCYLVSLFEEIGARVKKEDAIAIITNIGPKAGNLT